MRLAVISDIHGNLSALEAVLERIESLSVDTVLVAGDIVNGAPDSRACWELVRSRGLPAVRGNHERYLFDLGTPEALPEWGTERFGAVRWAAAQFEREELERMRRLPSCLRPADCPDLLVVHGSPARDNDNLNAHTSEEEVERMFGGAGRSLVVRGHNHIGFERFRAEQVIVTCGSVGMALDGNPTAQFLLLEHRPGEGRCQGWSWQHMSVPYDVDATLRRFHENDYLEAGGPMVRLLMREIATGSHQMNPFLRNWDRWSEEGRLSLSASIDAFLNAF